MWANAPEQKMISGDRGATRKSLVTRIADEVKAPVRSSRLNGIRPANRFPQRTRRLSDAEFG
jgi:hypothetical protein